MVFVLACDVSCVGCTGEGPDKCKDCMSGYIMEDEKCTGWLEFEVILSIL